MEISEKKKGIMNKTTFLGKLKDCIEFISFHNNKKLNGESPTNYILFNRPNMIEHFKKNNYFDEYDEYDSAEEIKKMKI